jgi:phosphatidylserine decarboxylase
MTGRSHFDRAFIGLQYLLPQHLLSGIVRRLSRSRVGFLRTALISAFRRRYSVDLTEAIHGEPSAYATFNDFFTRRLRPGTRPSDPDPRALICPVDGTVSQAGAIEDDTLLQAKGIRYSAAALLGDDAALAGEFTGGSFATLYLAPHNYHRVHMPAAGTLRVARFVPGDLFSVNAATAAGVPGLFARNERIACVFDTAAGPMAVVLVGALFVGSMSLAWTGEIGPSSRRWSQDLPAQDPFIALDRGAELGWFNMGSTVILLLPRHGPALVPGLAPGRAVRVGERLALAP